MSKRRTFIYCPHGHVVGEIVLRSYNGDQVSALYVYEKSAEVEPVELPAKRCVAIGEAVGIECSVCRDEVSWSPSNRTVVTTMVSLLNALYEPAARRDRVRDGKTP